MFTSWKERKKRKEGREGGKEGEREGKGGRQGRREENTLNHIPKEQKSSNETYAVGMCGERHELSVVWIGLIHTCAHRKQWLGLGLKLKISEF